MFDHLNGKTIQYDEVIKNSRYYCPDNDQIYKVVENPLKVTIKNMKLLHHYAAWILFVCKMVRIDLQVSVVLICTLLKLPKEQNYKKLRRGISYPNGNVNLPLLTVANDNGTLTQNTDASFIVRPDCTSHTEACLYLVDGSMLIYICKIEDQQ